MLILALKVGEKIHIGDDVEVYVTSTSIVYSPKDQRINHREVRLSIRAPRAVRILRKG